MSDKDIEFIRYENNEIERNGLLKDLEELKKEVYYSLL